MLHSVKFSATHLKLELCIWTVCYCWKSNPSVWSERRSSSWVASFETKSIQISVIYRTEKWCFSHTVFSFLWLGWNACPLLLSLPHFSRLSSFSLTTRGANSTPWVAPPHASFILFHLGAWLAIGIVRRAGLECHRLHFRRSTRRLAGAHDQEQGLRRDGTSSLLPWGTAHLTQAIAGKHSFTGCLQWGLAKGRRYTNCQTPLVYHSFTDT